MTDYFMYFLYLFKSILIIHIGTLIALPKVLSQFRVKNCVVCKKNQL